METQKLLKLINEILDNKKAKDIVNIEIGEKSSIADYFVVCTGTSTTHIKALADELEEELAKVNVVKHHSEGYSEGRWILMDYSSIIVHIFHQQEREYFDIERLWDKLGGQVHE